MHGRAGGREFCSVGGREDRAGVMQTSDSGFRKKGIRYAERGGNWDKSNNDAKEE